MQTTENRDIVAVRRREVRAEPRRARPPLRTWRERTAAAGKALIVYLFSGSLLTAVVAYLIFKGTGC